MISNKIDYSVVIPVFNSSGIIERTIAEVVKEISVISSSYELILVNDGSGDGSWDVIENLTKKYKNIIAINLLKNYGQHSANMCGFRYSQGRYVVTMDDDLQNPPSEIKKLVSGMDDDTDLVIGRFESKNHSLFRRIGSRVVQRLNKNIFDIEPNLTLSNFRLIRRDVIERVCKDGSSNPYIPGLLLKYSAKRKNVLVKHSPREVGKSNYNLKKIFSLVTSLLFNHTAIPLRFCAVFGFIISFICFALGVYFFFDAIVSGVRTPGWASIAVLISFFNGVLILTLSVIGEYLIRLLKLTESRNSYEVLEVVKHE